MTLKLEIGELNQAMFINEADGKVAFEVFPHDDGSIKVSGYGTYKANGVIREGLVRIEPCAGNTIVVHSRVYVPPKR